MRRIPLGTSRLDDKGEDASRPVRVTEPEGTFREEPCIYRLKGLALWRCGIPAVGVRVPKGWPTDDAFCVTHEGAGTQVAMLPTLREAKLAVQILVNTIGLDWTLPPEALKAAVAKDKTAQIVIACIQQRRFMEEGSGATPTQKGARA